MVAQAVARSTIDKVTARNMIPEGPDGGRSSISCVPNVCFRTWSCPRGSGTLLSARQNAAEHRERIKTDHYGRYVKSPGLGFLCHHFSLPAISPLDPPTKKRHARRNARPWPKLKMNLNSGGWEAQLGWRLSDLVYCESDLQHAAECAPWHIGAVGR